MGEGVRDRGMRGRGACMAGGMCGRQGACMEGGMVGGVHGVYMARGLPAWHTVNEWAVRILLECILVTG